MALPSKSSRPSGSATVVSALTTSEQRRLNTLLRKLLAGFGESDSD